VNLTRVQVKNSPDIQTDKPISEQALIKLHDYFNWPKFWVPMPRTTAPPLAPTKRDIPKVEPEAAHSEVVEAVARKRQQEQEFALRGAKEVIGYQVEGKDDLLGTVADFILEDANWQIRYLVLDTGTLLSGKKVLVALQWARMISHTESQVFLDLDEKTIDKSPAFDPETPINRRQEEVLYDFHGRPYYWVQAEKEE
jgi:hypothetical protein